MPPSEPRRASQRAAADISATCAGTWLMEYGIYGCCPSPVGFLPYLIGTQYCCKIEGAPPGKDYNISLQDCKCHRYGC